MSAQRIAGTVALASAAGLVTLAIVAVLIAPAWSGASWTAGTGTADPAMGAGMMGGMMGGGMMGPAMMGPGHMGFGSTSGSQGAAPPVSGAPTVTVTATDLRFAPTEITLAPRQANLTLVNGGAVLHDITVPALGVRVVAAAGQTTTVGLRDLPPGRYAGYCSVPGHAEAGMRIAVVVQ